MIVIIGSYIAWLCNQTTVYAMEMPGKRYDIGNLESYEKVKVEYKDITQWDDWIKKKHQCTVQD